jgi:hypothetical protein
MGTFVDSHPAARKIKVDFNREYANTLLFIVSYFISRIFYTSFAEAGLTEPHCEHFIVFQLLPKQLIPLESLKMQ